MKNKGLKIKINNMTEPKLIQIRTVDYNPFCLCPEQYSSLIVRSVNMYDELIDALNNIRQKTGITKILNKKELDQLNELLLKAKE